jgi:hypothetical protein
MNSHGANEAEEQRGNHRETQASTGFGRGNGGGGQFQLLLLLFPLLLLLLLLILLILLLQLMPLLPWQDNKKHKTRPLAARRILFCRRGAFRFSLGARLGEQPCFALYVLPCLYGLYLPCFSPHAMSIIDTGGRSANCGGWPPMRQGIRPRPPAPPIRDRGDAAPAPAAGETRNARAGRGGRMGA